MCALCLFVMLFADIGEKGASWCWYNKWCWCSVLNMSVFVDVKEI